jgi:ACS family glucarate transporter-like MFS transporter
LAALIPKSDDRSGALPGANGPPLPASTARWGVLGFSVAMSVLLYLDRFAIAVAAPAIQKDLTLNDTQKGHVLAAFFWSYALAQVPAGWLGDRWGGRRALTLYVAAWSLAMAGVGLAGTFASLLVMRVLLGVAQAGAYATTASFLRRWIPFHRRGFANGAVTLGGRAGGLVAPLLTPLLMVAVAQFGHETESWRIVFIGYALIGFIWAGLFWRWFRDSPREHPQCNAAEVALIELGLPLSMATHADRPAGIPWRAMLSSRNLWILSLVNFCINVGWAFLPNWLPSYLVEVHGMTKVQAGTLTSLTALAGMAACLSGGVATDRLVRRLGLAWGRRLPPIVAYGGAAIVWFSCAIDHNLSTFVALLATAYFLGDVPLASLWATYQDTSGPYAGTILGWANMCGNLGMAMATALIGYMRDEGFGWETVFCLSAASYAVAACCWLFIDPRVHMIEPAKHPLGRADQPIRALADSAPTSEM